MSDFSFFVFESLLRMAVNSTIVLVSTWLVIVACRTQSAATKHLVCTFTCAALMLLPLLAIALPSLRIGLLDDFWTRHASPESRGSVLEIGRVNQSNAMAHEDGLDAMAIPADEPSPRAWLGSKALDADQKSQSGFAAANQTATNSGPTGGTRNSNSPTLKSIFAWMSARTVLEFLLGAYVIGVGFGMLRLALDQHSVRKQFLDADLLDNSPVKATADECLRAFNLSGKVEIFTSHTAWVPQLMGLSSPKVVLPDSIAEWPMERVRAAIAHELAHVERHDLWIMLFSRVVFCLYWPQPLVYWLRARMRLEREAACDDRAIAFSPRPTQYARHLLDVAANMAGHKTPSDAALAMARGTSVEQRIDAILATNRSRTPPARRAVAWMLVVSFMGALATAIVNPFSSVNSSSAVAQQSSASKDGTESAKGKNVPPEHSIVGRVLMPNGKPAVGVTVRSTRSDRLDVNAITDADGRYQLLLEARGFHPPLVASHGRLSGFVNIQPDETDALRSAVFQNQDIILKPAKQVVVRVIDGDRKAVESASVYVQAGFDIIERKLTGPSGEVKVSYPDGIGMQTIGAVKPRTGCDYRAFEKSYASVDESHPNKLPQGFAGEVELVLNGVREATIEVTGPDDRPMSGLKLRPWLIQKPDRGDYWNLPFLPEFYTTTDQRGVARCDSIPIDQSSDLQFWPIFDRKDWFALGDHNSGNDYALIEWNKGNSAKLRIAEKIAVSGRVTDSQGRPNAGIRVAAAGGFHYTGWFHETALSDADGRWQMLIKPNGYYLFVIHDDQYAAKAHAGVIVREAPGPQDLDFVLQPARRVYGRVTGLVDKNTYVQLQQRAPDYYRLPEDQRLPNDRNDRRGVSAFTQFGKPVAADGSFQFSVGPGDFTIWSPDKKTQKFTIVDELDKEFNFALDRPSRGPLTVRAVLASRPDQPVANAEVIGRGIGASGSFRGTTGPDGSMQVERPLVNAVLLVQSVDKSLAGFGKLSPDDREVTVRLDAVATAFGRLVDENGKRMPNSTLEYGIEIKHPDGTMSMVSTTTVTTDAFGKFQMNGLCMGVEHELSLVVGFDSDGRPRSWRPLIAFTPRRARIELGDSSNPADKAQIDPAREAAKAFESSEPFRLRYSTASEQARANGQRLLIIAGSPSDPTAMSLFAALRAHQVKLAFSPYKVLTVVIRGDSHALDRKFLELAIGRQLDQDATELIVLNDERKLLASTTVAALQSASRPLESELVAFANSHRLPNERAMTITVTDQAGKPMPRATVHRNHVFEYELDKPLIENEYYETDDAGKAVVTLSGRTVDLRLWASIPGHVPLHAMWAKKFQSDGDKVPNEFTFVMQVGTEIGGRVVDQDGKPIQGATVSVEDQTAGGFVQPDMLGKRPERASFHDSDLGTPTITDANGLWEMHSIPPDEQLRTRTGAFDPRWFTIRITPPGGKEKEFGKRQNGFGFVLQDEQITHEMLRNKSATFVVERPNGQGAFRRH